MKKETIITSWNVNGIRACFNKGALTDYLTTSEPDILFLQETKIQPETIPSELENICGYHTVYHCAQKKGYSGVALFTKIKPIQVFEGIGHEKFDNEGRVIGAEFDTFYVFGAYFPNGQMSEERLQYKLDFYQTFFDFCEEFTDKPVIICGDYNTAHKEIDLARPKENQTVSGFLPIEREWLDKIIENYGYIDTFREFETEPNHYSWWTYRAGARRRNIGWRIDYVFTKKEFKNQLKDAFIQPDVMGSDHCPVGITIG